MSTQHSNSNYPKLHNAMWPGLVGKGSEGAEPPIDLDTMLDLTARAEVDGIKFDGVDLFLFDPHTSIDIDDDGIKRLAEKIQSKGFVVGSVVAPVWAPTGGGSAIGSAEDRQRFVEQVRKACGIAKRLRELGVRPYGIVRIDSACSVTDWAQDAEGNQRKIVETFSEACKVAESAGERLAAEGEICWGGLHSWKRTLEILEMVEGLTLSRTLGFQADMAHTLLFILGYNAPEDAMLPPDWDWSDPHRLDEAMKTLTHALRPWIFDFHVAQNDATVHGSGTHDKTGHHCLPNDANGKLTIPHHAGYWLHGEDGRLTRALRHICWDGCMFPNEVMMKQETWNDILRAMIAVRDAHGWREDDEDESPDAALQMAELREPKVAARAPSQPAKPAPAKAAPKPASHAPKKAAKPTRKKAVRPRKAAKPPRKRTAKKPAKKTAKKSVARRVRAKAKVKSKARKTRTVRKTSAKVRKPARKKAPKRRR